MFDSARTYARTITRQVGVLTATMLLTAAVIVAMPQQAQEATNSAAQTTTVSAGVGQLAASSYGSATSFVVTKGQKG